MEKSTATAPKKITESLWRLPYLFIGISIVLFMFVFSFVMFNIVKFYPRAFESNQDSPSLLGQLGDFSGGVLNPILSFATLIGVIYTIILSAKTSRQSDIRSADAVDRQTDQIKLLAKQIEILDRQSFEMVFFSLLQTHARNLEAVQTDKNGERLVGLPAIDLMLATSDIEKIEISQFPYAGEERHLMDDYCKTFRKTHEQPLSHYYKTATQIVFYIEKHLSLNDEQKKYYIEFYFSTLSSQEIKAIYIFAASSDDDRFLNLFKERKLIDWLPHGKVLDKLKLYPLTDR